MKIGIDIVENTRIERLLSKNSELFLKRVFRESEIEYIEEKAYRVETVAGLYAAKEAMAKSLKLGLGRIGFHNIEISHGEYGQPLIALSRVKSEELGLKYDYDLSISHENKYSIAAVISY